ncbi:MAG: hypothetical protein KDB53_03955 [Planctomycetes bacterium]|nr:hypothetical protein [Planctomycetota bacterium]
MSHRVVSLMVAFLILVSVAAAQVAAVVGPSTAPIGCNVRITISNDTNSVVGSGACPFTVSDATGAMVFAPQICTLNLIPIAPGGEATFLWNQATNAGVQVPAGSYTVNVQIPNGGGITSHPLTIGGTAGMGQLGVQRLGTAHNLILCAPNRPNRLFLALASLSSSFGQPIPGCTLVLPLDPDFLFNLVISGSPEVLPYLPNLVGVLNANGESTAPMVITPNNPLFAGLSIDMCFLTIDPSFPAACPIDEISAVTTITVM